MARALNLGPLLLQGTINLMIGYDPPANAAPDLNDPDAGDAAADAGKKKNVIHKSGDVTPSLCPVTRVVCLLAVRQWRGGRRNLAGRGSQWPRWGPVVRP